MRCSRRRGRLCGLWDGWCGNAVTLESEALLLELHKAHGGELVKISVARAEPVGRLTGWRPLMPVTQWSLVKR